MMKLGSFEKEKKMMLATVHRLKEVVRGIQRHPDEELFGGRR
jgi:hypothetical protein